MNDPQKFTGNPSIDFGLLYDDVIRRLPESAFTEDGYLDTDRCDTLFSGMHGMMIGLMDLLKDS